METTKMNARMICFGVALTWTLVTDAAVMDAPPGRVDDFNRGWKFAKGPQDGADLASFDDSKWQPVRLPHDWAISGPYEPQGDPLTGKLPWRGEGWYRKAFVLPESDAGKRVYLDFDGVMAMPTVFVNGKKAGGWDYGYMSFRVDASEFVKPGKTNLVVVHADTRPHSSRWYPGAGIYRKVQLVVNEPVHIAHWGTFVTTPLVTDDSASIRIEIKLDNYTTTAVQPDVETTLRDPNGKEVAQLRLSLPVSTNGASPTFLFGTPPGVGLATFTIAKPQLWDIKTPRL